MAEDMIPLEIIVLLVANVTRQGEHVKVLTLL